MRIFHTKKTAALAFVIGGIVLGSLVYLFRVAEKKPLAPAIPQVSSCKTILPGMRRIGHGDGFKFDIPVSDFAVIEGTQDTPPFVHGVRLEVKNSTSALNISFGKHPMESMAIDPSLTFSDHVEERTIVDDRGSQVGMDYWGYLKSGERWREVRFFKGGVIANYGFVDGKEAKLFDQVIDSVCVLPAPGP